jgi:hypothetical protein
MTGFEWLPHAVQSLLPDAEGDQGVLGVILTGSLAREGTSTPHSDADLFVIIAPEARSRWATARSPELDIAVFEPSELSSPALYQESLDGWSLRYAFAHAIVLLDKLDGGIQELVDKQATLSELDARAVVAGAVDGYINFAVRSLKSFRDGRSLEAHLDACESLPYAGGAIFGLEQRVRPYNKYLSWELERYPLENESFAASWLLPTFERILGSGDADAQKDLFATIEATARRNNFGDVFDGWGEDLALLAR